MEPRMKINELKPDPKNPRRISQKKLEMLEKSLKEFGDLGCIVVNDLNGLIVGAHQRLKVMPKDAHITITELYEPPTETGTTAEGYVEVNGERYKFRRVAWSEAKHKAASVAANQHGGEFDMSILPGFIKDIDEAGLDLDLLGFDQTELDPILEELEPATPMTFDDEAPTRMITCPSCGEEFDDN